MNTPDHDYLRCILVVTSKIISDLFAIRHLCIEGFDVTAKTVLRSTIEYIDVLVIAAIDSSICRDFVDNETNEETNEFWNKYFRGGKRGSRARRLMRKAWVEREIFSDYESVVDFDNWLYYDKDVLTMSGHASWLGGVFSNIVLGSKSDDKWLGMFGSKGEISTHTLHETVKHIFKFLVLSGNMPFEKSDDNICVIKYLETDELHKHTKVGRRWLISIYAVLIADPRGAPVFFPEIDTSNIWPESKGGESSY